MKAYYLEKDLMGGSVPVFYENKLDGGGMKWIRLMENYKWPKVNSLMEMCSGPGFMGYYLKQKYNIPKLVLIDIYEPVQAFIEKTNKHNKWENEVEFYISDSFKNYTGDKVDMIISNPPHLKSENEFNKYYTNSEDKRILLDDELSFHKNFLENIDNFLIDNGILVLLENKIFIPVDTILSMNPNLVLIDYIDHSPMFLYTAVFKLRSDL